MHLAYEYYRVFQNKFLSAGEFKRFSNERGLNGFSQNGIYDLWRLGLLRADIVISSRKINRRGLEFSAESDGKYIYADRRTPRFRKKGWGDSRASMWKPGFEIELKFHPFRFYCLYRLDRLFTPLMQSGQYLWWKEDYTTIANHHIDGLDHLTSGRDFIKSRARESEIAELAILLEPWVYPMITGREQRDAFDSHNSHLKKVKAIKKDGLAVLRGKGVEALEGYREELCIFAELLDDNKQIHTLLRLANAHTRSRLKGAIGGAVLLKVMAEVIRRASEETFNTELPEEDELGFGTWINRKSVYGTERILDAPRNEKNEFLFHKGLNYGIRVRCYIEGYTELGAFQHISDISTGVEFVNLKGNVIEKKGKGVSFRDALRNDIEAKIFSVVVLDNDRNDSIRVLKKASSQGQIIGSIHLFTPDIEMGNFTVGELAKIVMTMPETADINGISETEIVDQAFGVSSGQDFFKKLNQKWPQISHLKKGEEWGKVLMMFALNNPDYIPAGANERKKRALYKIALLLANASSYSYYASTEGKNFDWDTGGMIGE